ncbi:hypothetical protein B0H16DRAFT_1477707 [Mycena metata]|uniref:Uncharacterized protein n=1 Tax=Mycena metata TaxID=1033252 RepID=A0AAD7H948_9AGAR|nr:hypothetical protein B0H16DRAFT_1477707 [Mycena metata]
MRIRRRRWTRMTGTGLPRVNVEPGSDGHGGRQRWWRERKGWERCTLSHASCSEREQEAVGRGGWWEAMRAGEGHTGKGGRRKRTWWVSKDRWMEETGAKGPSCMRRSRCTPTRNSHNRGGEGERGRDVQVRPIREQVEEGAGGWRAVWRDKAERQEEQKKERYTALVSRRVGQGERICKAHDDSWLLLWQLHDTTVTSAEARRKDAYQHRAQTVVLEAADDVKHCRSERGRAPDDAVKETRMLRSFGREDERGRQEALSGPGSAIRSMMS